MKNFSLLLIGIIGGICGAFVFSQIDNLAEQTKDHVVSPPAGRPAHQVHKVASLAPSLDALPKENFVVASNLSTPSVVFIQTLSEVEYRMGGWMDWFFEPRSSQRIGSGSGVVFSEEGYIVTNNHVIQDADAITVIAGKKTLNAELVGRDPSSDLAVIKVNAGKLPAIKIGDSEMVSVGEWVLAVGNPFNLTSTVTAGIVSAKGRNINILRDKFPIESFIQTDAAINPGNSGGALVNSSGELIGINTAILSRTGSYAGYGFAIPVDIVKKVFNDLVKYGEVQKAFTGLEYIDIESELADRLEIKNLDGVIIADVKPGSASDKVGIKKRDVIRMANGIAIQSKSQIEELIAKSYPGDDLDLIIERGAKTLAKKVVLTNKEGTTKLIKRNIYYSKKLNGRFELVSKAEKDLLGIRNGVRVIDYENNGFFSAFEIPEGFIITQINNRSIESPKELEKILSNIKGRFDVIGINKRGRKVYYPYRR